VERFYAHTGRNRPPDTWDLLDEHLEATAARASAFAASFAPKAARLVGLWHDLGKYQPAFQRYLLGAAPSGPEHAIVGALYAERIKRPDLGIAIAAHHGALPKLAELEGKVERARRLDCPVPPRFLAQPEAEHPPFGAAALWIRFLFSALVDADSLETEHWDTGTHRSSCGTSMAALTATLETWLAEKSSRATASTMNELRQSVQHACRERSHDTTGAFRLTVPTGGGKTLASLLFALRHAVCHDLKRVIVVIPYTSIIDQTASVFAGIFGQDAVLEHHSNLAPEKDSLVNRHRVENWDSPIIVTTSVQFFESLHANRKRDLRKLHRIAESVVVLDEVQTFPLNLIKPIKDVLDKLVTHFRVSTVHCSATQPLLAQPNAREIMPDVQSLFRSVANRVSVEWPVDPARAITWPELARRIVEHAGQQVLVITHRKRDAIDLTLALGAEGRKCIHLSTLMCPSHRRARLKEIGKALEDKQPCTVVSTQLVEAGVDLDFPVVYRALAGVDSLAQAAGRCNREGRLESPGEFHVFVAPSNPPRGTPEKGLVVTRSQMRRGVLDLGEPELHARYFKSLAQVAVPASPIPELEKHCDFPAVEKEFVMIDDHGTPVVAPYGPDWLDVVRASQDLASGVRDFRQLQPLTVSVPDTWLKQLHARGCLAPLCAGSEESWYVLPGRDTVYSEVFGFGGDGLAAMPYLEL